MNQQQSYWGCQQVLLSPDKALSVILDYICTESNKIYNCSVYYARQMWFEQLLKESLFKVGAIAGLRDQLLELDWQRIDLEAQVTDIHIEEL